MKKIKIIVDFENSILRIKSTTENKLLFEIKIQPHSVPLNSGDLQVEFVPEQFDSDDK